MVLLAVLFYQAFEPMPRVRLFVLAGFPPAGSAAVTAALASMISRRLMHPPDVGAEAQEVVDLEEEQRQAVGMVIRSDQFPDNLFAPPKRNDLMADGVNPVYDKEMRSELFGRGTLMLRLVIQMSMFLALIVMAVCLYVYPQHAAWYTSYVVLFNILVGPVFAAGAVANERERQTLELLLTTALGPWQILAGKLVSSLRISVVLTSFLVWPILLAWLLPPWKFWHDTWTVVGYLAILLVTCLTTTTLAMFCSVLFRRTSMSMMTAYVLVIALFVAPVAVKLFSQLISVDPATAGWIDRALCTSPFAAAFSLPLSLGGLEGAPTKPVLGTTSTVWAFLAFYLGLDALLLGAILWLFRLRWRVAGVA
jgi:ABC-type transport system involved in multi-copper enzyme maturation permease subunit